MTATTGSSCSAAADRIATDAVSGASVLGHLHWKCQCKFYLHCDKRNEIACRSWKLVILDACTLLVRSSHTVPVCMHSLRQCPACVSWVYRERIRMLNRLERVNGMRGSVFHPDIWCKVAAGLPRMTPDPVGLCRRGFVVISGASDGSQDGYDYGAVASVIGPWVRKAFHGNMCRPWVRWIRHSVSV
jgi:hypothetical protein